MAAVDEATLAAAEVVADELSSAGIEPLLIGALAMAFHGAARATLDVDLGVATTIEQLEAVAQRIHERAGVEPEVVRPDPQDPLGGVLTLDTLEGQRVQVVNFDNPPAGGFPALVRDGLQSAVPVEGTRLRAAALPQLVMFKLYAGGAKSTADIRLILERTPGLDREALRALAKRYRLTREWNAVLRALG